MKLVFLLWLLYFLQGIPYGFQTKFLPVFLRSYSLSLTLISFTRLLSLPWLLKPLWAPLVDKYGSKISWVKYNLFGMAVCYLTASFMSLSSVSLTVLVVACLNIMAATQDIAVDSLFVSHLTPEDIGLGNIAQVVGYKTGSLFGGGFLGWLSSLYPWQRLFFLLFVTYIISALLCSPVFVNLMFPQIIQPKDIGKTLISNEKTPVGKSSKHVQPYSNCTTFNETCENVNKNRSSVTDRMKSKVYSTLGLNTTTERRHYQDTVQDGKMQSAMNKDPGSSPRNSGNFVKAKLEGYLNVYENVLKADGTKWTIVYVLIYKLGEQGMIAILPMFLLDEGMSSSDTAMLTGVLCQFCSIFGSLLAGMLFYWDGLQSTLAILSTVRFLSACVLTWLGFFNSLTTNWIGFVVSDCLLHLVSGMITTLTFTLMVACSQKCPRILSATHYSTLATFEVLGKLCMVSVSGTVVDMIGYTKFFVICTCLTLLPIILLRTGNANFQQAKVQVKD